MRVPPHGSFTGPETSASSVSSRVTPRIVRSPVIFQSPFAGSMVRETKVSWGCASTSRKSAERRWPSRSDWRGAVVGGPRERGVRFDGEEVGGAQVAIAVRLAGVDSGSLDDDGGRRVGEVLLVDFGIHRVVMEAALGLGDEHVLDLEFEGGVRGFEVVGVGPGFGEGGHAGR